MISIIFAKLVLNILLFSILSYDSFPGFPVENGLKGVAAFPSLLLSTSSANIEGIKTKSKTNSFGSATLLMPMIQPRNPMKHLNTVPKISTEINGASGDLENTDSRIVSDAIRSSNNILERKSFKRFMELELWRNGGINTDLEALQSILLSIEKACRDVNVLMRRISTDNLSGNNNNIGNTSTINIQGETQKKLDVLANSIIKSSLCCSGKIKAVASEEEDRVCLCSDIVDNMAFSGNYYAVFDPLDGSSNIDSGLPTGTIFGIFSTPSHIREVKSVESMMKQPGNKLVAAGYCLYSSSIHLVITFKQGLHMFTLDDVSGEFYLTKQNLKIPDQGNIYSFNDAYFDQWLPSPAIRYFLQDFRSDKSKKPTARYFGALVADMHNIIMNGGVFGYGKTTHSPKGKLRLVYEANPISLLIEQGGGLASDGEKRILSKHVDNIHQRTSFYAGSKKDIEKLEKYVQFYKD